MRNKKNYRAKEISRFIGKAGTLIDVGTDHAYIPIECLMEGICHNAMATDISMPSLRKASENIRRHNLSDRIETILSDGLKNVEITQSTAIVIAGLGSLSMIRIIENSKDKIKEDTVLVLQPASRSESLKKYLFENSFDITAESFFIYKKRPYQIIRCNIGYNRIYMDSDEDPRLFVPSLYDNKEKSALKAHIMSVLKKQKKALSGYEITGDARLERQKRLVGFLEEYYESL